jgi:hypothetical protein
MTFFPLFILVHQVLILQQLLHLSNKSFIPPRDTQMNPQHGVTAVWYGSQWI